MQKRAAKLNKFLIGLYLLITGGGIGWLIGLSVSPVVSIVITAVTGSAAAIIAALSGLEDKPDEAKEASRPKSPLLRWNIDPLPLMLLVVGILLGSLALAQTTSFTPSPHVYRMVIGGCAQPPLERTQTGFRVKDPALVGIVTALHGVAGCKTITAMPDGESVPLLDLTITQIDIARDVALLGSKQLDALTMDGLTPELESSPEIYTGLQIIGYHSDIARQAPPEAVTLREITELVDLVPNSLLSALFKRRSPALDIHVLNINGNLLPGHSGAPILNGDDRIVGVGNGGIDLGRVGWGWAIPWQDIEWKTVAPAGSAEVSEEDIKRLDELAKSNPQLVFSFEAPAVATVTASSPLFCTFAFRVLDKMSEQPLPKVDVFVTIEEKQITGFTDSTGYYSGKLPCRDLNPNLKVRVQSQGYLPYTETVVLVGETKEILLAPIGEAPTAMPTFTLTPSPVPTLTTTGATAKNELVLLKPDGIGASTWTNGYEVEKAFDKNEDTNWLSWHPVTGDTVQVLFREAKVVSRIGIYHKPGTNNFGQMHEVKLTFDNDQQQEINFKGFDGWEYVDFEPVQTMQVSLEVVVAYPNNTNPSIFELAYFGPK